jgi:hypothetical protein
MRPEVNAGVWASIRAGQDHEFARYGAVLRDTCVPIRSVYVGISQARATIYFQTLLAAHAVPAGMMSPINYENNAVPSGMPHREALHDSGGNHSQLHAWLLHVRAFGDITSASKRAVRPIRARLRTSQSSG